MGNGFATQMIKKTLAELINDTKYVARVTFVDREYVDIICEGKLKFDLRDEMLSKIELCGIVGKKTAIKSFEKAANLSEKQKRKNVKDLNLGKSRHLSVLFKSELEMIKKYHESAEVYSVKGGWRYVTSMSADDTTFKNIITTKVTESNETTHSTELNLGFEGVFKAITASASFKSNTSMTSLRLHEKTDYSDRVMKYNSPKDIYQEVLEVNSSIGHFVVGTQHILATELREKPTDRDFTVYKP